MPILKIPNLKFRIFNYQNLKIGVLCFIWFFAICYLFFGALPFGSFKFIQTLILLRPNLSQVSNEIYFLSLVDFLKSK